MVKKGEIKGPDALTTRAHKSASHKTAAPRGSREYQLHYEFFLRRLQDEQVLRERLGQT